MSQPEALVAWSTPNTAAHAMNAAPYTAGSSDDNATPVAAKAEPIAGISFEYRRLFSDWSGFMPEPYHSDRIQDRECGTAAMVSLLGAVVLTVLIWVL